MLTNCLWFNTETVVSVDYVYVLLLFKNTTNDIGIGIDAIVLDFRVIAE